MHKATAPPRLMIKLLFSKGTGFSPYINPAKSAGL